MTLYILYPILTQFVFVVLGVLCLVCVGFVFLIEEGGRVFLTSKS